MSENALLTTCTPLHTVYFIIYNVYSQHRNAQHEWERIIDYPHSITYALLLSIMLQMVKFIKHSMGGNALLTIKTPSLTAYFMVNVVDGQRYEIQHEWERVTDYSHSITYGLLL